MIFPDKTIVIHPADLGGCGHYRLRQPAKLLAFNRLVKILEADRFLKGEHILDIKPKGTPESLLDPFNAKLLGKTPEVHVSKIVTQRQTHPKQAGQINRYRAMFPSIPVQMDLDDLVWNVPPSNPYHKSFPKEFRKALFENLKTVDIMTTSTVPLALEIEKIRKGPVQIYPNLIASAFFTRPKPRSGEKLRVGWAGSTTHEGDLGEIKNVVMQTLNVVDWIFMGYCPNWAKGLVQVYPSVKVEDYMRYLPLLNLDVAIAPLEHNLFNECKSNLKLVEFSAVGVPVITTDIYPYKDNPGFKIGDRNSFKKWMEAIEAYNRDESLRLSHAEASYNWALSNFQLEAHLETINSLWLRK